MRDYINYRLQIDTTLTVAGSFDILAETLVSILPCNLLLELQNTLKAELSNLAYIGGACSTAFCYLITMDMNVRDNLELPVNGAVGLSSGFSSMITHDDTFEAGVSMGMYGAVGLSSGSTHTVTNDVAIRDAPNMELNYGIGVGYASTKLITTD